MTGAPQNDLARIGRDPVARQAIIDALKNWERANATKGEEVRETTSGHVVDDLFAEADVVTKTVQVALADQTHEVRDLVFSLLYRSKVGREFAMADSPLDHVWEPQTTKLLLSMAARARAALIGGAYAGDHAVPMMAAMSERSGVCYCFEPNTEQADMLKKNAQENGLDNYTLSNEGLWSQTATLVMVGADSHAHPELHRGQPGEVFEATTIDDFCKENSIETLDIVMLDIEGGELEALRGARRFLAEPAEVAPEVIFEIHRSYVDWSDGLVTTPICRLLVEHGYELYAIRDYQANVAMHGAPVEVVPIETCHLAGPPHGFNVFASKRSDCVERHRLRICPNVSPKLLAHRDPALHAPLIC